MPETEIIRLAATQGIFAVLFVALLFYVLRENSKREDRLMKFIDQFSEEYRKQTEDIERLESKVDRVLNGLGDIKQRI